jgi:hypothetical protein
MLYEVVRSSPHRYSWRRPTWTREMLVETLAQKTGIGIHVATMVVSPSDPSWTDRVLQAVTRQIAERAVGLLRR